MQLDLPQDQSRRSPRDALSADCPILLTERLTLRAPHIEDVDALAHLANNARVATMVSRMPHPYSRADAVNFVNRATDGRTIDGAIGKCVYAITIAETGAFLGCVGLEPHDDGATLELGYWLGQPYWGAGYATEAAHAVVDMAFRTRDIEQIDARCRVTNHASRRVIQKCGFQYQGTGMVPSLALGGAVPVEWFRLDRKTWISLRTWGAER